MSTTQNPEYLVGDEATVSGVVVRVDNNGGNYEYTVAVATEGNNRPVSIPPRVHPAAFTNGPVELAEANQKTYDEAAEESEKATKELEEDSDDNAVKSSDSPKQIREKTVTPNPAKTPAGNANANK